MSVITLNITATNSAGASGSASVQVTLAEAPTVSVSVSPQVAAGSTLRTATVTASDPNGLPIMLAASRSDGGAVTQTGPNEFQFTY